MNKKYLEYFLYIGIGLFCTLFFVFKIELADAISYSVTGCLLLFYLYYKILWKFNPKEETPKLKRKYSANITYIFEGEEHAKNVEISIEQDLFNIYVTMETDESFSRTISSTIYKEQNVWYLTYTYINQPDQKVSHRSRIHYGTCTLNLNNLNNIKGQYYTDRKSVGDISFR